MLLTDFYTIKAIHKKDEFSQNVSLFINKNHAVFSGHFPNKPVVPGVCMMQILKEVVSTIIARKIQLTSSRNIKFVTLINPIIHSALTMDINYEQNKNTIRVKSDVSTVDSLALKMDVTYTFKDE